MACALHGEDYAVPACSASMGKDGRENEAEVGREVGGKREQSLGGCEAGV
jgi:hypothetical protein